MILFFDEWLWAGGGPSVLITPTANPWQAEHELALLWRDAVLERHCKISSLTDVEKIVNVIGCRVQDEAGEECEHATLSNRSSSHS